MFIKKLYNKYLQDTIYIKIQYKSIYTCAIIALICPNFLFILFYLKLYFAIPLAIIIIFAFYLTIKKIENYFYVGELIINKRYIYLSFIFTAIFILTTGIGGFFPESFDQAGRNPIFYDLIFKSWPVIYDDTNCALTYYFGYWLLPSLIGKIFNLFLNNALTWHVAKSFLYVQTVIFFFLIVLLIFIKIKSEQNKQKFLIWIPFLLFGFTGIHIISAILRFTTTGSLPSGVLLLEWANPFYTFNGIWIATAYAFNQTTPAILAVILFLCAKNCRLYAMIGLSLLSTSPIPLIGLVPLMIVQVINNYKDKIKQLFKDCISVQNIIFLVLLIFFYYFYLANSRSAILLDYFLTLENIIPFLLYSFLEFGAVGILLFKVNYKNPLYYASIISLLINRFVLIKSQFMLRGSLAPLVILMIFFIKLIYDIYQNKENQKTKIFIVAFCTLCAVTVAVRMAAQYQYIFKANRPNVSHHIIQSFSSTRSGILLDYIPQYITRNPNDNYFYSKLSKADMSSIRTPDIILKLDDTIDKILYREKDILFLSNFLSNYKHENQQKLYINDGGGGGDNLYLYSKPNELSLINTEPVLIDWNSFNFNLNIKNAPVSLQVSTGIEYINPYQLNMEFVHFSDQVILDPPINHNCNTGFSLVFIDDAGVRVTSHANYPIEFIVMKDEPFSVTIPIRYVPIEKGKYTLQILFYQDGNHWHPNEIHLPVNIY